MASKRRGRPPKDDRMEYQYRIRLTAKDAGILDYLCERQGKSKADVLRKGLLIQYNMTKI